MEHFVAFTSQKDRMGKIVRRKDFHTCGNLPSQNRVTSVRLSLLNKFKNVVARLLPKLFHLRQNCC